MEHKDLNLYMVLASFYTQMYDKSFIKKVACKGKISLGKIPVNSETTKLTKYYVLSMRSDNPNIIFSVVIAENVLLLNESL